MKGLHLHLDPASGIAGDMAVAALVELGVPAKVVEEAVAALGVPGLQVRFERRKRGAFVGTGYVVEWPEHAHGEHAHGEHDHEHAHGEHDHEHAHGEHAHGEHNHGHHDHEHRDHAEIQRLLARADLPAPARTLAQALFRRIAEVEAALHGTTVDAVRFHEVGAFDSIADVVGFSAALTWLAPASVSATAPVVGTGTVRTAHGLVPVPAPATAALLRGLPMRAEGRGELTTPTGAAILAEVVQRFGPAPDLEVVAIGHGAGLRELSDRPNLLRALLGKPLAAPRPAEPVDAIELAANIDDMSPELVPPLVEALLAAGALDAWSGLIVMKKGRPAIQVGALVPPSRLEEVEAALFAHSTTLGVRRHAVARTVLDRRSVTVETPCGPVSVKLALRDGRVVGSAPEFEDCLRLAQRHGVPVPRVMVLAQVAAARIGESD